MIELHRMSLTYLLNSIWQVPAIVLAASLCSLLLRKAGPAVQHRLWVSALAVCALLPLAATNAWLAASLGATRFHAPAQSTTAIKMLFGGSPSSPDPGSGYGSLLSAPTLANMLLMAWLGFALFRAMRLILAWRRAASLVRESESSLGPTTMDALWADAQSRFRIAAPVLLLSERISAPATLNAPKPVLLLPSSLASEASDADFAAIFAHEAAHIQRRDFLLNLLYEFIALPIAYHPVAMLLRSRITESRELVCDELAATSLGDAPLYARSLVRIAEFLSQAPQTHIRALGIFEGRNLEKRIMALLDRKPRLGRMSTAALVLATSLLFASCCFAATAFNFQPAAVVSGELKPYAGTWLWMFKGKPFVTMRLIPAGDHFAGSMTNGFFHNDADGNMIDAGSHSGTSAITRTFFSGKVLHIVVQNDKDSSLSEWAMTLLSPGEAQFSVADEGSPKNLKPWLAERAPEPPALSQGGSDTQALAATASDGSPVYRIGGAVLAPRLISGPDPEYSDEARRAKMQGVVIVRTIVDARGKPQDVRIVKALGNGLDQNAVAAVKQYRFKPATLNGKPVAVQIKIEVMFQIR